MEVKRRMEVKREEKQDGSEEGRKAGWKRRGKKSRMEVKREEKQDGSEGGRRPGNKANRSVEDIES